MTALVSLSGLAARTGPLIAPLTGSLADLRQAADRLSMVLILDRLSELGQAVDDARAALLTLERHREELLRDVAPASVEQIEEQLERLVHAFPEAAPEDLAGYGAQLANDVITLRPSWRALRLGCEEVRLRRRYTRLPAIGTVWEAIRAIDEDVRATTRRIDELPARIRRAEAIVADEQQRAERSAARRQEPAHPAESARR